MVILRTSNMSLWEALVRLDRSWGLNSGWLRDMEYRTFAEGPVNAGGCGPLPVFWIHRYTLATKEEHGHLSGGFWKAVDRVRFVEPATFFSTGNLDWHAEYQLLSANGSDEFGQPSASRILHIAQKLVPSQSQLNRSFKMRFIVTPPYAILLMFFFLSSRDLFLSFLLYCTIFGAIIWRSFLNLHVLQMLNKSHVLHALWTAFGILA